MTVPTTRVVATAGHVDHGKSALILRLTGMDPDRLAEEKRRGLTIDLGFAWGTLPSGTEIGFVDVPGHERFVGNMLAGVGPVRLVLFVVAADEGWKPQSEEHLSILDVLGVEGAVVALTKSDLVDADGLALAHSDAEEHLRGAALEAAPIVACSAVTGDGLDELRAALDAMIAAAPAPIRDGRPRQFVDRVFSIRGAGTVATGTLTGGPLRVGEDVEVQPSGARGRIRALQTHKRDEDEAEPGTRVAVNLVGVERASIERGDVLAHPGAWRATRTFEAELRGVRGLLHGVTDRGAYKLYAGSAERDARIRLYGTGALEANARGFARVRLSTPLPLEAGDRFVLRDTGRRETVAGGTVLDVAPPSRPGPNAVARLASRKDADPARVAELVVRERGAIRSSELLAVAGRDPVESADVRRVGAWWVSGELNAAISDAVHGDFTAYHRDNPMRAGADLAFARRAISTELHRASVAAADDLVDTLLDDLLGAGVLVREGSTIRLATHAVSLSGREGEVDELVERVSAAEPAPPTVNELVSGGIGADVIEAATATGRLVRVSPDLVMTPALVNRAEEIVRSSGADGLTVSAFREALGTSRKFALPLLELFDARGVTLRRGDARVLRERPGG
ncbi:MAG: selenocysteine-specific translation elongation factor [Actinomycetota bacterium]|nr:selenocysteine-specific translation elongation factor [Actinomycetota bacterium]